MSASGGRRLGEAGVAHRGAARRLPRADRAVRQGGQHRDVRGGRPQPLRRLLRGGRSAARAGRRDAAADDHRRRSVVSEVPRHARTGSRSTSFRRRAGVGRRDPEVAGANHVAVDVSRRELRHALRAHAARLACPVPPTASTACARSGSTNASSACGTSTSPPAKPTFLERHTGLFQMMLVKNGVPARPLQRAVVRSRPGVTGGQQRVGGLMPVLMERADLAPSQSSLVPDHLDVIRALEPIRSRSTDWSRTTRGPPMGRDLEHRGTNDDRDGGVPGAGRPLPPGRTIRFLRHGLAGHGTAGESSVARIHRGAAKRPGGHIGI